MPLEAFHMNNMRLPGFAYHEPTRLEELLSIKQELKQDCLLLAGGTDLLPMLKTSQPNCSSRFSTSKGFPG